MKNGDGRGGGAGAGAEFIGLIMAQHGFSPVPVRDVHHIQYVKRYAEPDGRLARAVALLEREGPVLEAGALAGFDVTVQSHLLPLEAQLETAPMVMRADLVSLSRALFVPTRSRSVVMETCARCRASVSEFFVERGTVLCRVCR